MLSVIKSTMSVIYQPWYSWAALCTTGSWITQQIGKKQSPAFPLQRLAASPWGNLTQLKDSLQQNCSTFLWVILYQNPGPSALVHVGNGSSKPSTRQWASLHPCRALVCNRALMQQWNQNRWTRKWGDKSILGDAPLHQALHQHNRKDSDHVLQDNQCWQTLSWYNKSANAASKLVSIFRMGFRSPLHVLKGKKTFFS